jgi:hypothetical protein
MGNENQKSNDSKDSGKESKTLEQILNSLPKPMKAIHATEGYEPKNELPILREDDE